MSEYIEKLNDVQREAVVNYRFPSLIVAGAGSGKTRVLTCRIAYMLEQGVPPQSVLALTFTNKAAREMRERIGQLLSPAMTRRAMDGDFSLDLRPHSPGRVRPARIPPLVHDLRLDPTRRTWSKPRSES